MDLNKHGSETVKIFTTPSLAGFSVDDEKNLRFWK